MLQFPHHKQFDTMDCGPSSLKIVAEFYGKHYSLQNLRDKCHISRKGVSLLGISDAAESIGFRTSGVKIYWEQLRDEANLPCIVHWNQQHFIVVYKIKKQRDIWYIWVSDPASGLLKYSEQQFRKSWEQTPPNTIDISSICSESLLLNSNKNKGIALLLEPTNQFYEEMGDEI